MDQQTLHLIEKARDGSTRAMNQLFGQWYKRVYNIAWKYFAEEEAALEVCQQSFLAMQRHFHTLNEPAKFEIWLYRTVINQCHQEHRRQRQVRDLKSGFPKNNVPVAPERPDQTYQREEVTRLVLNALQQLPEDQRTVLIMKEYEGLKFREIAEVLDISENTAKSRLYYGLQNLKKILLSNQASKEICHG